MPSSDRGGRSPTQSTAVYTQRRVLFNRERFPEKNEIKCASSSMIAEHTPHTEVVECASPNCSNLFERPLGVRGRPQQYCSRLCGNFTRLLAKAEAQPQFRPFTYAPAQRRAAQDNHTADAHTESGAVQSAHDLGRASAPHRVGHGRTNCEPHRKQQTTANQQTRPKQGRENL